MPVYRATRYTGRLLFFHRMEGRMIPVVMNPFPNIDFPHTEPIPHQRAMKSYADTWIKILEKFWNMGYIEVNEWILKHDKFACSTIPNSIVRLSPFFNRLTIIPQHGGFFKKHRSGLLRSGVLFIRRYHTPWGSGTASARNPGTYPPRFSLPSSPEPPHSWRGLHSR